MWGPDEIAGRTAYSPVTEGGEIGLSGTREDTGTSSSNPAGRIKKSSAPVVRPGEVDVTAHPIPREGKSLIT